MTRGQAAARVRLKAAAVLAAPALLAGCVVGPNYSPPKTAAPAAYALNPNPGALLTSADWWPLFGDPELSEHVEATLAANQDLALAVARYDEARALLGATRAGGYPQATLDPSAAHVRTSGSELVPLPRLEGWHVALPVDAAYELDLWGRVRRSIASARAQAESAEDAVAAVRLSLAADTATAYLLLRATDREITVLAKTVTIRQDALRLAQRRVAAGAAGDADAIRAQADLSQTAADLDDAQRRRAIALHALAVLEGRNAPDFDVPVRDALTAIPSIPTGLPAHLLQRRPDLARDERALAAASEQIGVAEAAFFPTVRLAAAVGVSSRDLGRLLEDRSLVHSLGPSASLPLFDGGRNRSNFAAAQARYREALAVYRQSVLRAFHETQDALSDGAYLERRAADLNAATLSSIQAAAISRSRYERGLAGYFEVVESERAALLNQRAEIQNDQQRMAAAVSLIKALGGGWTPGAAVPETPAETAPGRVPSLPTGVSPR